MPSPFPGMDPYLENILYWRSVHSSLITCIMGALNAVLPDAFMARGEGRAYILPHHQLIYPDALNSRAPTADDDAPRPPVATVATVVRVATTPLVLSFAEEEVFERYLQILSVDDERVVTVLEVLSPTNKARESTGRAEYVKKQRQTRDSSTHLLEIDLLRAGQHTVAVPPDALRARVKYDYLSCVRRAGDERYEVYPFTVRDRMPVVRVPLSEGWDDTLLDLQEVWDETYRLGAWHKGINYRSEPDPPLSPADTEWADDLLRGKGLRP